MIQITKSALHILDFTSDISIFSQSELSLSNHVIQEFLYKHVERAFNDPALKTGNFFEHSKFLTQMRMEKEGTLTFLEFSTKIAEMIYNCKSQSEDVLATDIVICEITEDGHRYIGILEFVNNTAYTHQVVQDDTGIKNEIIKHYAILASPSQRLGSFAFIDMERETVKFIDKKSVVDGNPVHILPEMVLECTSKISSKDTVKIVKKVVNKIAQEHGENSAIAISKAKKYISENSQVSESLEPIKLGREVFRSSEVLQEKFKREMEAERIPESIPMERSFAEKTGKSHKIKTDTGIEITFPADYFENNDLIEFINNPNGTISIEIKNIGKIINK